MENNILVYYIETNKGFNSLRSITIDNISFDNTEVKVKEKTCLIDPFVMDYGPLIIDKNMPRRVGDLQNNDLTIVDLKEISPEIERLYSKIKELYIEKIEIDAIDYSCKNEKCILYKILIEKKKSYIRIPLGPNFNKQPGQPYVLEIWPAGKSSSIHNHGNAVAIIKVLYGIIKVELFNSFEIKNNPYQKEMPKPINILTLKAGDITWMTPFYYQTHRLSNEKDSAAITIQAYAYTNKNTEVSKGEINVFQYLTPNNGLGYFHPNEDLSYDEFKTKILNEYLKQVVNISKLKLKKF
jgi:hypothetical protein